MEKHHWDDKQLENLNNLAYLGFTIDEIATFFEMDRIQLNEFFESNLQLKKCYNEGKMRRKILIRKSLVELAENGSHPAILKVLEIEEKQDFSEESN